MADEVDAPRAARKLTALLRVVDLVRPHRARFIIATLALLMGSGLSLLYPQAARMAIDLGIKGGNMDWLDEVIVGLVLLFLFQAVLVWTRHYLMSWLGERAVADLRRMVFDALLTMPAAWFHERRTGELTGRLSSDVTVIEGIVGSELSIALRNVVQLIGGVTLLFVVNARLTLYCMLIVPPLALGAVVFGRVIRRMSRAVQDRLADASGHVQESVGAIQTVQAFVREGKESATYANDVTAAFEQALSLARWRAGFIATVSTAGYFGMAAIVWLGGRAVIRGDISPGDLTAFLLYTLMVATSMASVASLWGSLQRAAGATERLFEIIDTVPDIRDPDAPVDLPDHGGEVSFRAVDFRYPSRLDHPVLTGLNLAIAPGEVVALVGPSGAGKSTITQLLLRFHDVTAGAVQFEGVDLRQLRLADLRRATAIVAQEPVLFSGSIRDNIAYSLDDPRDDASQAAIESAARDAHAHEFIARFPDGYDTVVGERGVKLSGGQRQRVAIARAILADPRVLILDEATSNLDAESEALVQEALQRLMRGRTTLIIAHRLSTVRDADRIALLDGGCIAESGTHDELMALGGTYARLVEHQVIVSE